MPSSSKLKKAELAAFDDSESLAKEAKAQAMDMFDAETGRQPQGQPLAVTLQGPQILRSARKICLTIRALGVGLALAG